MLWDFLLTHTHTKPVQQTKTDSLCSIYSGGASDVMLFFKTFIRKHKIIRTLKQVSLPDIQQKLPLYTTNDHSAYIAAAAFSPARQDLTTAEILTTAKRNCAAAQTALLQFFVPVDKKDEQFLVVLRTFLRNQVRNE